MSREENPKHADGLRPIPCWLGCGVSSSTDTSHCANLQGRPLPVGSGSTQARCRLRIASANHTRQLCSALCTSQIISSRKSWVGPNLTRRTCFNTIFKKVPIAKKLLKVIAYLYRTRVGERLLFLYLFEFWAMGAYYILKINVREKPSWSSSQKVPSSVS